MITPMRYDYMSLKDKTACICICVIFGVPKAQLFNPLPHTCTRMSYVMKSGKTWLMGEQKNQTVIRHRMICAASDQSLDFLSHMSICKKYFSGFLYNLKESMNIDI